MDVSPRLLRLISVLNNRRNRAVIGAITESGVTASHLEQSLEMPQPTVCRALNDLRAVGLVTAAPKHRGNPGRPPEEWVRTEPTARKTLEELETIARRLVEPDGQEGSREV